MRHGSRDKLKKNYFSLSPLFPPFQQKTGDLLRLRGKVLHVSSSIINPSSSSKNEVTVRIRVRADVVKPEQAASEISNTFVFAFKVPLRGRGGGNKEEEGALSVKRVLPEMREEALAAAAYEVVVVTGEEE